jgi:hypothetical protein
MIRVLRLAPTTGHLQGQQQHLSELSIFVPTTVLPTSWLDSARFNQKVSIINDILSSFELQDSQSF